MSEPLVAGLTIFGVLVAFFLLLLVMGCSLSRFGLGWKAMIRTMQNEEIAEKIEPLLDPKPEDDKPSGEPLRVLSVLQRESRLIDFLMEDLQGADDSQIAAAVRDIQPKSQATLKKYLVITPVIDDTEDATVEVPAGFDPSAIQVIGNVSGNPPYKGNLSHPGWYVKEINLTPPPEGQDEFVLQPAEVEIP